MFLLDPVDTDSRHPIVDILYPRLHPQEENAYVHGRAVLTVSGLFHQLPHGPVQLVPRLRGLPMSLNQLREPVIDGPATDRMSLVVEDAEHIGSRQHPPAVKE